VWFGGVELGYLTGTQRVFAVSDDESQPPGEDIEPFVALVGDEPGFAGAEHLLEHLHAPGVLREWNQDTATVSAMRFQVDPRVAGRRCGDELVQCDTVGVSERDEQIEGRVPFTCLQARQRAHREPRRLSQRLEGDPAVTAQLPEPRADARKDLVHVDVHGTSLQDLQIFWVPLDCPVKDVRRQVPRFPRQDTDMTVTTAAAPPALSTSHRWMVLAVCSAAMFLVGLDTTIVNVALPRLGLGLGTDTRGLEWVVDAYTIVFASLLITSGAIADRWGRRRVFQTGLITFGLASVLCALAPSIELLVSARVLQGVGASMLSPVALAIVVNAMPDPKERAKAIGVWASVFGLSMAAGPVTGGALIAAFDWRAVFWINVPIIVAALVLVAVLVPESRGQRARRLDLPGQVMLVALVSLVVGLLIEGPHVGWTSRTATIGGAVAAVVLVAFIWVESRRDDPLIDPDLFRVPSFTGAVLAATAVFVALSLTLLLTTLYLQNGRGWSPFTAGAATLPMAAGATVCAPLSGLLVARVGARRPLILAGGFIAAGGLALTSMSYSFNVPLLLVAYGLLGVGVGFANAPITNTAVNSFPPERAGVAGGTTSTARQVGAALGIAIAGGLVAGASPDELAAATEPGWLLVVICGLVLLAGAGMPRWRVT